MGADLLLVRVITKKDKKLNWAAGRAAIKKLDLEVLKERIADVDGDVEPGGARRRAQEALSALKRELAASDSLRDGVTFDLPGGYTMHLRGGTSWGDDPSEGWTTFVAALDILGPEVLKPVGFWYPPKPRATKTKVAA